MKYLFESWDKFRSELDNKNLILFLDYDGTLAPITDLPDLAVMTKNMHDALIELSNHPKCHVVVISGRMLNELKRMVNIEHLTCVGSHGFEIEEGNLNVENLISDQYREDLAIIKSRLEETVSVIAGVWVEDKKNILGVHYRLADEKKSFLVKRAFLKVCGSYRSERRINIVGGKKVFEVRPPIQWGKGEAAVRLLSEWQKHIGKSLVAAVYIGDDATDEEAFKAFGKFGTTIKVGESTHSFAQYFFKDQTEVLTFLKKVISIESHYI